MRRMLAMASLSMLLVTTGCMDFLAPDASDEEMENEAEEESEEAEVSPEIPTLSQYFRSVFPDGTYVYGEARGFGSSIVYNRLDLERIEVGLSEIASERFDPSEYFFQEGQYIERAELNSWLSRLDESEDDDGQPVNPRGLNPPLGDGEDFETRESSQPRVLSHINEQNFYRENEDGDLRLGGVAIALSMNSVYYFRERFENGQYGPWLEEAISAETSLETGQAIADEVVTRLRSEEREEGVLNQVPIVVALFREAPRNSTVPGEFIAFAEAPAESELSGWETLNETHYFFPSDEASDEQPNDADRFQQFSNHVNSYFNDHIGITARGHYQNDQMHSLNIQVPIRFHSKTETIAITQQVTSEIENQFPADIEIAATITSNDRQEALITRSADEEEANVHIYE